MNFAFDTCVTLIFPFATHFNIPFATHFNFIIFYPNTNFLNGFFYFVYAKQQAVIEKFNLCEDNLSGLLKWIGNIEQKIASVGGPKEYIDELRNQINLLKVKFYCDFFNMPMTKDLRFVN